jgi:hypothetical protein
MGGDLCIKGRVRLLLGGKIIEASFSASSSSFGLAFVGVRRLRDVSV